MSSPRLVVSPELSSSPHVPSPLNPTMSLSNSRSATPTPPVTRPRVILPPQVVSTPSSLSFDDFSRGSSSFRSRSRSPGRNRAIIRRGDSDEPSSPSDPPSSWWGGSELIPRPWRDPPRRKKTIPPEQTESWVHTRERVAQAAASVLGTAGDIAHEALLMSVELLDFAPVPGLQTAAKTLLNIWDTLQMVDMNRLACLRLTERCAEILLSVRQEVKDAGDSVGEELAAPIAKLVESFSQVHIFLKHQSHRPFLKRYLKRDEILKQIAGCDSGLGDALGMFSLSIQIRILKQVQAAEARRQADNQALLNSIMSSRSGGLLLSGDETPTGLPPSSSHTSMVHQDSSSTVTGAPPALIMDSPSQLPASQILPTLRNIHSLQNSLDAARDMADLRGLMRTALQTSSDVDMLNVLQVGREEMPEAIKTLQRALERVVEKDGAVSIPASPAVPAEDGEGKVARRVSVKQVAAQALGEPPGPGDLQRSQTTVSITTESAGSGGESGGSDLRAKDTLDREFIESGIDAMRRMSKGVESSLPSWTITRYEVDREKKIGIGFFSDVYKGTWRGRTVAIKVLAETTPRKLFVREVGIWKTLRHANVLELYGASSAAGDPPWFFVSPYEKNGSLVEYLKRIASEGTGDLVGLGIRQRQASFPIWNGSRNKLGVGASMGEKEVDLHRFMHEIAKGMEYLHSKGVLHGDLKAANILVDDKIRCVISDFGQSEMKSEAYRISGTPPPHGTLRWQAPELMAGMGQLTTEMDVYAYAISCIEILSMGRMPWPLMDDDAVRYFVTKENSRPEIPHNRFNTPALQELLRICWDRDPFVRPPFSKIVRDMKQIRKNTGHNPEDITSPRVPDIPELDEPVVRPSPDMRPINLPVGTPPREVAGGPLLSVSPASADSASFRTARDVSQSPPKLSQVSHREDTVATSRIHMPEPVLYTPSLPSSRASSIFTHTPSTQSEENINLVYEGYDSPPPADERIAELRNERRYRLLLAHEFHPSLTLPLWTPVPVALGSVGYLSKPSGTFVTLFNSFSPDKSSEGSTRRMPSLYGYGRVASGSQRQDKRNAAQRGLDAFVGLLTFKNRGDGHISKNVSRRYSFPLRAGHKMSYLCTETTMYRYVEDLDAPKKWFKANVDLILEIYGAQHHIQKEDLFLVIGTLDTPDYALFVSHNHSDGQAHFNVFSSPKSGLPWGTFTTDTEVPPEFGGPSYHEAAPGNPLSASKVSNNGGPWDTVLIARLRFKPDVLEPTSL
ncbi:hypothetical protein BD779DRAFT_1515523 [Infundibulicybe gibba]|nr:hypothetical protein BD779DRAFT_1515523 [Infundibulicybe gibba]